MDSDKARAPEPTEQHDAQSNGSEGEQSIVEENALTFPIVGIGASAGGLAACEQFFGSLPPDSNMAFVLIQHLDPDHESELASLLQRHTTMSVIQVHEEVVVQPNRVYVIPPGKVLRLEEGKLRPTDFTQQRSRRASIDVFLRSLAEDVGERAVCIILSGTGTDGTLGLKRVKERSGVVMVQDPEDAQFGGMPIAATATGLVDLVAPADELGRRLVSYYHHAARRQLPATVDELSAEGLDTLREILNEVRTRIGYDFSAYKSTTILRRVQRRMHVNGIDTMSNYLTLVRDSANEVIFLYKDFLISVTNFFRDGESFEALQREVIPQIIAAKQRGETVRVWVPGCATGEEAYSLAMILLDEIAAQNKRVNLQIFATDLDREALDFGRTALYPRSLVADLTPAHLARYFTLDENGYRVREDVRQSVLFAEHNLLTDPPFSAVDLISCRNVLIYLQRETQRHVFAVFHYALRPEGYLFLGSSETAEGMGDLFKAVDKKHSLYRRLAASGRSLPLPFAPSAGQPSFELGLPSVEQADRSKLPALHLQLMLQRYAPPSLIVDTDYRIRYLFGDTQRFLQRPEGAATDNVLENVHANLRVELRALLFQLFQQDGDRLSRELLLDRAKPNEAILLKVERIPADETSEELALVIFEPRTIDPRRQPLVPRHYDDDVVEQLEMELQRTQHRLQTFVEEYETSNEELKATNEELQSTNEELRSMTEELETSKEELQSTNEELYAVNTELKAKVNEVSASNADLQNLMASTQIATLFLDRRLRLKRFTPQATDLFYVIESDIGRPLDHIANQIEDLDLPSLARRVLDNLDLIVQEITTEDGNSYLMRMMPYRTLEDAVEGVVVTFVAITQLKEYQDLLAVRERQQTVVAELGQLALSATDLQTLMDEAVRRLSETLHAPYCKVLELLPDGEHLLLKAGVGWQAGLVGEATVDTGDDSQAGYTLRTKGPVIVEDLRAETRFNGPALLQEHGVISGMSVVIGGLERPYGVLGVHTREHRHFSAQDAHFLQGIANVLGTAVERHQAEAALRHNEERLRMALHAAAIGTWRVDLATGQVSLDAEMNQLFGRPAVDEVLSQEDLLELIDPDDRLEAQRVWERAIAEMDVFEIEHRVVRPDGARRWLRNRGEVTRDADGEAQTVTGVVLDITEQKQAYEQQARLAAIVESSQTAIMRKTPQGVITDWNPSAVRIFGWRVDEAVGQSVMFMVPADRYEEEEELLARVRSGEPVRSYETVRRTRDGTLINVAVSLSPIWDDQGQLVAISAIEEDITEQKQAYEQQARLAAIVESSQTAIIRTSADSIITDWNPSAERIFGWRADEAVGQSIMMIIPESGRAERAELYARLQAGESIRNYEVVRLTRDGETIDISMNLTPMYDEKGRWVGISGVYEDITARKQARIERRRLNDRVEAERALLQTVLQQLPSGVIIAEAPSGRTILGNEQVAQIFRHPYREADAVDDYVIYKGYYADGTPYQGKDWPLARAVTRGETVHNEEITIERGDGTMGSIAASAAPVYDSAGRITAAVVVFSDITAMKETEAHLRTLTDTLEERVNERTAQVRRLAADLTRAEEEERRRVAQVLHDHLQQLLFGAQVKLSILGEVFEEGDTEGTAQLLSQLQRVLGDSIHVTRRLVVDLSPPVLEGEGLKEAVTWLAAQMRELHGLEIDVISEEPVVFPQQEIRVLLFHLARELLFNVVKHADVDQAEVQISLNAGMVRLVVEDHGKGFEIEEVLQPGSDSTGLSRMRERVRLLGGTLTIYSKPYDGTRITVEVPLGKDKPVTSDTGTKHESGETG